MVVNLVLSWVPFVGARDILSIFGETGGKPDMNEKEFLLSFPVKLLIEVFFSGE